MKTVISRLINSNKITLVFLLSGLLFLQYSLWFGEGGILSIRHLNQVIAQQVDINTGIDKQNKLFLADILDLKNGHAAIEEVARSQLQMIKPGEIYYQLIPS